MNLLYRILSPIQTLLDDIVAVWDQVRLTEAYRSSEALLGYVPVLVLLGWGVCMYPQEVGLIIDLGLSFGMIVLALGILLWFVLCG